MADHYLYIASVGLTAFRMGRDGLSLSGRFGPATAAAGAQPSANIDAYGRWLQQYLRDRFYILLDTAEEELVFEDLPALRPMDRARILRRRLDTRLRDIRFKRPLDVRVEAVQGKGIAALLAGRPSRATIGALRGEVVVSPWIEALKAASVRLQCLQTPALLSGTMLGSGLRHANGLLVSMQPGGLRQTWLTRGIPQFTRLSPVYRQPTAEALMGEFDATLQYLLTKQIIGRYKDGDERHIWVVGDGLPDVSGRSVQSAEVGGSIPVELIDGAAKALVFADPADAANLGALPDWISALRAQRASDGYLLPELRIHADISQFRNTLRIAAVTSVVCSVSVASGFEVLRWQSVSTQSTLSQYQQKIDDKERELRQHQVDGDVNGSELNLITEAARGIRDRHTDARAIFELVARSAGEELDLRFERLAWRRGGSADGQQASTGGGSMAAMSAPPPPPGGGPARSGGPGGPPPPGAGPTGTGASAPLPPGVEQIELRAASVASQLIGDLTIEIDGSSPKRLGKVESNRRAQALADRLKAACACEVTVTRWPFDNSPASSISDDFDSRRGDKSVKFEIRAKLVGAAARDIGAPARENGAAARRNTATAPQATADALQSKVSP